MTKRSLEESQETDTENVPPANIAKKLRALEEENARLRERIAKSENTVQQMAEMMTTTIKTRPRTRPRQTGPHQHRPLPQAPKFHPAPMKASTITLPSNIVQLQPAPQKQNLTAASTQPVAFPRAEQQASARGVVRQRINSPRQFYLTLLAMYCSAFAHVMHGPDSEKPIVSRADAKEHLRKISHKNSKHSTTSNCSQFFTATNGTASAEADMESQKYERMLRASSHGLLRLIEFRRKIVRERQRGQGNATGQALKLGNSSSDSRDNSL